MTRISIEGVAGARLALGRVRASVGDGADDAARAIAADVAEEWRRSAPVDTGAYRDSIESDDDSAFSDIEYAHFVEFGTSNMPAQPAASEAAAREEARAAGIVTAAIARRLSR